MKKMFWNKFKVRSAAAVLAAALAFSMSAPLALAAQPEEAAASAGTVQEADMPTLPVSYTHLTLPTTERV